MLVDCGGWLKAAQPDARPTTPTAADHRPDDQHHAHNHTLNATIRILSGPRCQHCGLTTCATIPR